MASLSRPVSQCEPFGDGSEWLRVASSSKCLNWHHVRIEDPITRVKMLPLALRRTARCPSSKAVDIDIRMRHHCAAYPTQIAIPRKLTGTMPAIWLSQGVSGTTTVAPCSRCGNAGFDNHHDRPEAVSGSVTPCKRMRRFTGRQHRSSERSRRLGW
jgi:hypothetical protein